MDDHTMTTESGVKVRRGDSRAAIIAAAEKLILERGYGAVSMDDLAIAAGVARRTLYNQFASKEEIFREMLARLAWQLEHALPPGIETQGDVEDVLRLIAQALVTLHKRPEYLGFFRIAMSDSGQFPWIGEAFAAVIEPGLERLARYLAHLTKLKILNCPNPMLAARQFTGIVNEFFLWPMMMGHAETISIDEVIDETIGMFLGYYRVPTKATRRSS
jgi:AcrR family transcriptional regulator